MNDVTKSYRDSDGNIVNGSDEAEPFNGSIINAFKYDEIKTGTTN